MKDLNIVDESFEIDGFSNIVNYPAEDVYNEVFSNMVNYPAEDVHNEVFSNMVNDSRRSSKVSKQLNFEIFSGQDGSEQPTEEELKRQKTAQTVSDTVTAVGGAVGSVVSAVQAFQDPSKKSGKEFKKELKAVCGRRPILKKKRPPYDACVKDFMERRFASASTKNQFVPTPQFEEPKKNNKVFLYVGIGVAVLVAGFVVYKVKFAKK